MTKRPFAVFDIDGTIARNSLLQYIALELANRGQIRLSNAIAIDKLLHDSRQTISDDRFGEYMKRAVEMVFSELPEGLRVEEYDAAVQSVVRNSISTKYSYTTQLMKTLKSNGYFLIAISGSEFRAVETFSRALDFDAWLGAVKYEEVSGRLTGKVEALGYTKDQVLRGVISKFDLDEKASLAVGDTSSDIPMLEMVSQPIAFNPNQALFKVAREKGWMIVVERKDVVYGLTKEGDFYRLVQSNV